MRKIFSTAFTLVFTLSCLQLIFASSSFAAKKKVLIGYSAKPDIKDEDDIRSNGGKVKYSYRSIPAIAVEIEEAKLEGIKKSPKISYIEPDYVMRIIRKVPNDLHPDQWGLDNDGHYAYGTPDADINAPEAWDLHTGSSNVVIAMVDTGVDYSHVDLSANMWINTHEINGNGIDDDHNGYVDDFYGYDFRNGDGDPMDDHSHGTHCSGIIAAVGNNGIGIVGVNWNARIMALKSFSASGSGYMSDAAAAIQYAIDMKEAGVPVIAVNASWGSSSFSLTLKGAIEAANDAGILVVAGAGNNARDNDVIPFYPASYEVPNVISVTATDYNDKLASFSSYGTASVDLAAPGVSIMSTIRGNSYSHWSGTSMATPHVTGVAALVRARDPGIAHLDIKNRILGSVDPLADLAGKTLTGGRLNAFNALNEEIALSPDPPSGLVATTGSLKANLDWNDNSEPDLTGYKVYRSMTARGPYNVIGTAAISEYVDTNLAPATSYYYVVTAVCGEASESGYSNEASLTTPPSAPTGLTAGVVDQQVNLDWNDSSELVRYNVYRGTRSGGPYSRIAQALSFSKYTDTDVSGGNTYYYVVTAVEITSGKEGEHSNEASATIDEIDDVASVTLNATDNTVRYSDDKWYRLMTGRYEDFQLESLTIPAGKVITSVIIYVEHYEDVRFSGYIEWSVEGKSKIDIPIHITEETDSWDVTNIVGSPGLLNLEIRIENKATKMRKTNIDCIYAEVELATTGQAAPGVKTTYDSIPIPARNKNFYRYSLMQNNPNPFNPETWIPYSLAKSEFVLIKIYDITGQMVKTLNLGEQSPGDYSSKEKAAYWDGRNESGEQVSSGIYFYTMEAGKFRAAKRMLVLR